LNAKLAPVTRKHNYVSSQLSQNRLSAAITAADGEAGFVGPMGRIDSTRAVDVVSVAIVVAVATFIGRVAACLRYLRDPVIPGCH
jgi:hypothetical protein